MARGRSDAVQGRGLGPRAAYWRDSARDTDVAGRQACSLEDIERQIASSDYAAFARAHAPVDGNVVGLVVARTPYHVAVADLEVESLVTLPRLRLAMPRVKDGHGEPREVGIERYATIGVELRGGYATGFQSAGERLYHDGSADRYFAHLRMKSWMLARDANPALCRIIEFEELDRSEDFCAPTLVDDGTLAFALDDGAVLGIGQATLAHEGLLQVGPSYAGRTGFSRPGRR